MAIDQYAEVATGNREYARQALNRGHVGVACWDTSACFRDNLAHRFGISLIEWPKGEKEPAKYWLSNLPNDIGLSRLVDLAKLRWRIERDYQEHKQEIGLGHFEGRGWRGFHHHATLCVAAYGFLISERETIPPSGPCSSTGFQASRLPKSYRPRGAPAQDRTSHPEFNRDHAPTTGRSHRPPPVAMSMLRTDHQAKPKLMKLMTQ